MAQAISPLFEQPTRARYVRYLDAMYHYTLHSGPELRHAATLLPHPDLANAFERLASEESGHYRLAQADLAALGHAPSEHPSEAVLALRQHWMNISRARALQFVGMLYALENVGAHAAHVALGCLGQLSLEPEQVRFVAVHLKADERHGRMLNDACREHWPAHADDILQGARDASRLWVALHLEVLRAEGA
jgi:hypothetical protein